MEFLKNRFRLVAVLTILIIVGGIFIYRQQTALNTDELKSTTVKRGDLKETLILSGEIKADDQATVSFQTSGLLANVAVKENEIVEKGSLIASLNQQQMRKTLQKELNDFMKERWDLEDERDTYEDEIITDSVRRALDKAQFDVNNSILDVELQTITIQLSNIYAPISGIVSSTYNTYAGINVTPATQIATIIDPDSVYFELTADQTEVAQIRDGMTGNLTLDAFLDEKLNGRVSSVSFSPQAGELSTVYPVRFMFLNSSNVNFKYRLGMTGEVEFVVSEKPSTLFVPFNFVREQDGQTFVRVLEDGEIVDRPVEIGIETDEFTEILSGVSEGETIYD